MILIIDNYDSFTYNLVQLIGLHTKNFEIVRNDKITVEQVTKKTPEGIVISPGPGRPENAGICVELIRTVGKEIPILGVCLGHQAIGYAFSGKITHAPQLMHGKTSMIHHNGKGIFQNVPEPFEATRYHSLIIDKETLSDELTVTAKTDDDIIMGIKHKKYPIEGIQFHPESVLTTAGPTLIANWLKQIAGVQ
jgi:anthranilate synthase/aminodeoxychorismate synthase-like glutamine amidotransferase